MNGYRTLGWGFVFASGLVGVALAGAPTASPATPQSRPATPEEIILQAMRENPITAPYRFTVKPVGRQYAISGSVGSGMVHEAAVRTLLGLGIPIRDDLTIDTRQADRVAASMPPANASVPYAYPPPILNRVDDPFYGFEPPLLSYPAWWGAVARRAPLKLGAIDPTTGMANATLPPGSVQLTLDDRGTALLRGVVASVSDREELARKVAEVPGITEVLNEIEVATQVPAGTQPQSPSLTPPPPPTPVSRPIPMPIPAPPLPQAQPLPPLKEKEKEKPKAETPAAIPTLTDVVAQRVSDAISRRPVLAKLGVKVLTHDGLVTLSGSVPSAYEAMLAYRAVEQTPGVRTVDDRLEFRMPEDDAKNPLRLKGRPEDVERYLSYQIRRQLGDLAHVDRVHLMGDVVEIQGSVAADADLPRVQAVLRSIPLLRGFRIEPNFHAE